MALPLWRTACISVGLCVLGILTMVSHSCYYSPSAFSFSKGFQAPSLSSLSFSSASAARLDAVEHMARSMAKIALGFPMHPLPWQVENEQVLTRLVKCQMLDNCSKLEREVVILRCDHFAFVKNGVFNRPATGTAGEGIWADSFMWGLEQLGHPYLVISGNGPDYSNTIMSQVYHLLSADPRFDPVKLIVTDYLQLPLCIHASNCLASPTFPQGIPWHKLFIWNAFWTLNGEHRYGAPFALTFFPGPPHELQPTQNFTFVGLTLEQHCSKFKSIPLAERPNKAWILGKFRKYFFDEKKSWPIEFWDRAQREIGNSFYFEMGTTGDRNDDDIPSLPNMIQDVGTSERETFMKRVGESKVMIGVGKPELSSSPLEALCMGVPFINPVFERRNKHQVPPTSKGLSGLQDRKIWFSQHRYLQYFDEPYVYNVDVDDYPGFVRAIKAAISTPIQPYIPNELKAKPYLARIEEIIHHDWKAQTEAQEAAGDIRVF